MFQTWKRKFAAKQAVWARETQQRIAEYAEHERQEIMEKLSREQQEWLVFNNEINNYLKTVQPVFLLKPEVCKALLNLLYARSDGTAGASVSLTKEVRKAYAFYHKELKVFLNLLERKGCSIQGKEERFLTMFMAKLRERNYQSHLEYYSDIIPGQCSVTEAFAMYFEAVEEENTYESGHVDFFATHLKNKRIVDAGLPLSRLIRNLKQYEKENKDDIEMRRLEKRLTESC